MWTFSAIQRENLFCAVCIKVGHSKGTTDTVRRETLIDRDFISVLIQNVAMDFKNQRIDNKLLFPCVSLGVGKVDFINLTRQLRYFRAAVMNTVFQPFLFTGI